MSNETNGITEQIGETSPRYNPWISFFSGLIAFVWTLAAIALYLVPILTGFDVYWAIKVLGFVTFIAMSFVFLFVGLTNRRADK